MNDQTPNALRDDEVEPEDTGGRITEPFDPNKIRVRLWTPTVDLVLKRIQEEEIVLTADFQRGAGIWSERAQSRLIESLLIRIPLPAFYVDGETEEQYIVIDGIQRLTAMQRFVVEKSLRLKDLEFLTDHDGAGYEDLPRALRRRIEETMLTIYIVEKGTPPDAKLNIFKRINTGGIPLSAQEIRHAINPGPVREFLKVLAEGAAFQEAVDFGVNPKRMDDRECVARFMAFVMSSPSDYTTGDLDAWINSAMASINGLDAVEREALAERFVRAMQAAKRIFDQHAFRKMYDRDARRLPINKALFETWSVNLDALSDDGLDALYERRAILQDGFVALIGSDKEFEASVSGGTGDIKKVQRRFTAIANLIRETIDDPSPEESQASLL